MDKGTWMKQLRDALANTRLGAEDRRAVLNYYEEMYRDKLEDGKSESEILKEFGFPTDVAENVGEGTEGMRTSPPFSTNAPYERYNYQRAPESRETEAERPHTVLPSIMTTLLAVLGFLFGGCLVVGGVATAAVSGLMQGNISLILLLVGIGLSLIACGGLLIVAGVKLLRSWKRRRER